MIVLASASKTRAHLLEAAGIAVTVLPSCFDEAPLKGALRAAGASAASAALALAEAKAREVSERRPEALVIGADQMLECGGEWYDKPADRPAARAQLLALCGRTHHLRTAVAAFRAGQPLWRHGDEARLTMRPFSEGFLDRYLEKAGSVVLASVGAYQLEGLGAQLFSAIDGDHFTILGLPLLPLLAFLRQEGIIEA